MGLRSYDASDLEHGYRCTVSDCKVDHDSMQPHESLLEDRILMQMDKWECGLIVDGIWGETNLMFPFAVYEAKKSADSWEHAENQVYHACRTYLAMLDDLARNPTDVTRYQSKESESYQLFGFTSCGSYWKVYIAWHFLASCVSVLSDSYDSGDSSHEYSTSKQFGKATLKISVVLTN